MQTCWAFVLTTTPTSQVYYINLRAVSVHSALISSCVCLSVHPNLYLCVHICLLIFFCLYRPTPKVEWKKKDGVLANTDAHVINFDRWLHFDSITLDDVGEYECKASNTHGSTTHFFTVTVEGRPLTWAHSNKQVWLWCSAEPEEVISMLRGAGFNKTVSKLGRGRDIVIYVTIIHNNGSTILKMHFENCRMHFLHVFLLLYYFPKVIKLNVCFFFQRLLTGWRSPRTGCTLWVKLWDWTARRTASRSPASPGESTVSCSQVQQVTFLVFWSVAIERSPWWANWLLKRFVWEKCGASIL